MFTAILIPRDGAWPYFAFSARLGTWEDLLAWLGNHRLEQKFWARIRRCELPYHVLALERLERHVGDLQ